VSSIAELMLVAPRRILTGSGCRQRLAALLAEAGHVRPFVVVDPRLADEGPLADTLDALASGGRRPPVARDVTGEPEVEVAEAIARRLREGGHDAVIAIGGGSVIDAAKGAAISATNPAPLADYEGWDRFAVAPLPLYALPTTAGTGSEVTRVTVLGVSNPPRKISIKSARLVPTAALIDPDFLRTVPARVAAAAATDALTHALEAYLRPASSPVSRALGFRAATQILAVMQSADTFREPSALAVLAEASMLAGLAFGNSDVGPVHCLAESIGAVYKAPHGAANAVFLGPVLAHYGRAVEAPLAAVARAVLLNVGDDGPATRALIGVVDAFVAHHAVGTLRSLCGGSVDVPRIAQLAETNNSNASGPTPMDRVAYASILDRMLGAHP
jgi:alcohol dehydrogenase